MNLLSKIKENGIGIAMSVVAGGASAAIVTHVVSRNLRKKIKGQEATIKQMKEHEMKIGVLSDRVDQLGDIVASVLVKIEKMDKEIDGCIDAVTTLYELKVEDTKERVIRVAENTEMVAVREDVKDMCHIMVDMVSGKVDKEVAITELSKREDEIVARAKDLVETRKRINAEIEAEKEARKKSAEEQAKKNIESLTDEEIEERINKMENEYLNK